MTHSTRRALNSQARTSVALSFAVGLFIALSGSPSRAVETNASTRWIWVPGPQSGTGCEAEIRSAHQSFMKRIKELLAVEVVLDGQSIACQDERCLSARMVSAGAKVGLMASVTCTERALSLDLLVLPLDRPALTYREGMSLTQEGSPARGARPGPRGGAPLSGHLTQAQRVGLKLANSVTLGPPPRAEVEAPSALRVGVLLSLHHEVMTLPESIGGGAHLELAYLSSSRRALWYGSLGVSAQQSPYYAQRAVTSDLGGRYRLSEGRLSPVLGGGLQLSYERARQRVDTRLSFEGTSISREETYIQREDQLQLRPALEAGLNWRGRALELSLITRLSPSTLVPFELAQGAWSTLLGVRW